MNKLVLLAAKSTTDGRCPTEEMMRGWQGYGMMNGYFGWWSFFAVVTWLALLVFLILGSVYFWKQIQKKK